MHVMSEGVSSRRETRSREPERRFEKLASCKQYVVIQKSIFVLISEFPSLTLFISVAQAISYDLVVRHQNYHPRFRGMRTMLLLARLLSG